MLVHFRHAGSLLNCLPSSSLSLSLSLSITRLSIERSYHSITGIFGNYRPYQTKDGEDAKRQQQQQQQQNKSRLADLSAAQVVRHAFQRSGHRVANLDPLSFDATTTTPSRLDYGHLGRRLNVDLEAFVANDAHGSSKAERARLVEQLHRTYCQGIAFEFSHLSNDKATAWLEDYLEANKLDAAGSRQSLPADRKKLIAADLLEAEALDHFLAKKFQSVKRYGCEGAETMITFVNELIRVHGEAGGRRVVIGMPHRGRLNLLVNTMQFEPAALFHKLAGRAEFDVAKEPGRTGFIGDVISHLYTSTDVAGVEVTMLPNPSHLEAIAPAVCGYLRGVLMDDQIGPYYSSNDFGHKQYLPLQIHGDASFAGQGIVAETLEMANVEHFAVGGSIHLIVNNQVGYTMPGRKHQARSSLHCSDAMKMIDAPVIHVNGARPELVVYAARLAHEYRQRFGEIGINLVCYRHHGHNELDDPTFTNPQLYKRIRSLKKSIPRAYADGNLGAEESKDVLNKYNDKLNRALQGVGKYQPPRVSKLVSDTKWKSIGWASGDAITKWATPCPPDTLQAIGRAMVSTPEGWNLHSTLKRVFKDRHDKVATGVAIDWATAELLAFGSLMAQGYNVRISGQDVGRGTFSQRHAMIVDQSNEDVHVPLNNLGQHLAAGIEPFGKLEVCNSILSEEAVMAFEYGLSLASPQTLPIWEAQFGDFFNGAQTIIDTMVSSGEAKWLLPSSLTLLLPHGWDGAGPEHTSSRVERFLQMSNSREADIDCDNVNWNIVYPSTPAQYFHLLRRQMLRSFRKPAVVLAPKMLLRHPRCVSTLADMSTAGGHFATVLDDPFLPVGIDAAKKVQTIIFCSGKHYYTLEKERSEREKSGSIKSNTIALVRLEELVPFPAEQIAQILSKYSKAQKILWCQEEQRNMGAWNFVSTRFRNILKQKIDYVGREELAAPAVAIGSRHQLEVKMINDQAFASSD